MANDRGTTDPGADEEQRRRRRGVAWWWWVAGALGVLAVVAIALSISSGGDDSEDGSGSAAAAPSGDSSTVTATPADAGGDSGGSDDGGSDDADADDGDADGEGVPEIEGVWEFVVTVTETSGACAGEEDEPPGIDNVTIRQVSDDRYTVTGLGSTPESEWSGRWDGTEFVFDGEREEDDGVTVASFRMRFTEDGALVGDEDWSWSDSGSECPTGKSEVVAYFYAPLS